MLNRNPDNYFADVEQAAFYPANFVPGIGPSPDKMLQGRLFAYGDAHRYRLGVNHSQLPVNRPHVGEADNYQRDGAMRFDANGRAKNYEPNSFGGPAQTGAPGLRILAADGPSGTYRCGPARATTSTRRPPFIRSCRKTPRAGSSTTSPPVSPRFPRTTSSTVPSPTSLMPTPITAPASGPP